MMCCCLGVCTRAYTLLMYDFTSAAFSLSVPVVRRRCGSSSSSPSSASSSCSAPTASVPPHTHSTLHPATQQQRNGGEDCLQPRWPRSLRRHALPRPSPLLPPDARLPPVVVRFAPDELHVFFAPFDCTAAPSPLSPTAQPQPICTLWLSTVPVNLRSLSTSVALLFSHLLGDFPSPTVCPHERAYTYPRPTNLFLVALASPIVCTSRTPIISFNGA